MTEMTEVPQRPSDEQAARDGVPALPLDESRLAQMRRVKRMPLAERIALLDRMCREGTRIATRARRVR